MAYELEKIFLAEKEAKLEGYSANPQLWLIEIQRHFEVSRQDLRSLGVTFLNAFTSVKNTVQIDAGTTIRYVDDPLTDNKVFPGRWRLVRVLEGPKKTDSGRQGIVQILRYGWAQELTWAEAMLDNSNDLPGHADLLGNDEENYLLVRFPNFDPAYARSAAHTFAATETVSGPTIQGTLHSGTWNVVYCRARQIAEDGGYEILVLLAKPQYSLVYHTRYGTPKEETHWRCWSIPKPLVDALIADTEVNGIDGTTVTVGETGVTSEASYSPESGLVNLIFSQKSVNKIHMGPIVLATHCRETVTADFYYGYSASEVVAFALPASSAGVLTTLEGVDVDSDGLFNFRVVTRAAENVALVEATTALGRVTNVTKQTAASSQIASAVASVGVVEDTANFLNEDCSYRTERRITTAQDLADATNYVVHKTLLERRTQIKSNTALPSGSGIAEAASAGVGFTESLERDPVTGVYRLVQHKVEELGLTGVVTTDKRADRTTVTTSDLNQTAQAAAPTLTGGTSKRVANTVTALGAFLREASVSTAIYLSYSKTYADRYGNNYIAVGVNATSDQVDAAIATAAFTALTNNSLSVDPSLEFQGLYNYAIGKAAYDPNVILLDEWAIGIQSTQTTTSTERLQSFDGVWYQRTNTHHVFAYQSSSLGGADSFVSTGAGTIFAGAPGEANTPQGSSRTVPLKNGQYLSFYIHTAPGVWAAITFP